MKNNIFLILILTFFSKPSLAYYYSLGDLQGLSNTDYRETLVEFESTVKEIMTHLTLVLKQDQKLNSNIYESSIFNQNLDLQLKPLSLHIKKLPDKVNYLTLELNTTMSRFSNFQFSFIQYLNESDIKIFQQTKEGLKEDMLRFYKISSDIIKESDRLKAELEATFLRRKKISKFQYKEYMVLSQPHQIKITNIAKSVSELYKKVINLTNELNQHKRITNQIYDSYQRKLSLSLGVKDSSSFIAAFESKVTVPLRELREKIALDRSYSDLDKNAFAFNYYYNQLLRSADFSKALNLIGRDFMSESEMSHFRAIEQSLDFKLMDYTDKPGAIRSLVIFLDKHFSPMSCKLIF